jgi:hypothetical protein
VVLVIVLRRCRRIQGRRGSANEGQRPKPGQSWGLALIDPQLKAVVARRTDMDVGDPGVVQPRRCLCGDLWRRHHSASAIDDPVVRPVTAHDVVRRIRYGGQVRPTPRLAGVGTQKDRPRFGSGLSRGNGPMHQHQHRHQHGTTCGNDRHATHGMPSPSEIACSGVWPLASGPPA